MCQQVCSSWHALLSVATVPNHSRQKRSRCSFSAPAHGLAKCCQSRVLEQERKGWLCRRWAATVLQYRRLQIETSAYNSGLPTGIMDSLL